MDGDDLKPTFANSLTHNFDVVSNQVATGIMKSKRMTKMLTAVANIQKESAQKILAVIEKEWQSGEHDEDTMTLLSEKTRNLIKTRKDATGDDGMLRFTKCWTKTQDYIVKEALKTIQTSDAIYKEVIVPLLDAQKSNRGLLREVAKDEKKYRMEMKDAALKVLKTQDNTQKLIERSIHAQEKDPTTEASDRLKKKGLFAKVGHKLAKGHLLSPKKVQEKAYASAKEYEEALEQANKRQDTFLKNDLPMLFSRMQQLEKTRLTQCGKVLTKYVEIKARNLVPMEQEQARLFEIVAGGDAEADIQDFLSRWVAQHGLPPPAVTYTYSLPCSADDIFKGKFEGSPNSFFCNTLENIMKLQEEKFPDANVPHILDACIESLVDNAGLASEGIFRISIPKGDLDGLIRQFDAENYQIVTDNPNAPAALLKQWLRLLEAPLIPTEMYSMAIVAAQTSPKSDSPENSQVRALLDQLPAVNRAVLERICTGLVTPILLPEHVATNRMSIRNLAIVFAPGFLRNPSDDPMEMLNNSKFETSFVVSLFETLVGQKSTN